MILAAIRGKGGETATGKTRHSALRRESDRGQGLLEDEMAHMFLPEDVKSKQAVLHDLPPESIVVKLSRCSDVLSRD
jgi:hypothetical protein